MNIRTNKVLLSLVLTTTLSACGGSNESSSSEPNEIPNSEIVTPINAKPEAKIKGVNEGVVGQALTITGEQSSDSDGDQLSYKWKFNEMPEGAASELIEANKYSTTFIPDLAGVYIVELIVNDGVDNSDPITFAIEVTEPAKPPVAIIDYSGILRQGQPIELDGSASTFNDKAEGELSFEWSFFKKPDEVQSVIERSDKSIATFTPEAAGDYIIRLIVTDSYGATDTADLELHVTVNQPPVVEVTVDFDYIIGSEAYAYSLVQDEDDDAHEYLWSFDSVPESSELGEFNYTKKFLAFVPDAVGDYQVSLAVSDGVNTVETTSTKITIAERNGYSLSVGANSLLLGKVNEPILIDYATSISPTGSELSYGKTIRSAPSGSMPSLTTSIIDKAETEFESNRAGTYLIRITATNKEGETVSKDVRVILTDVGSNLPPVPKASVLKRVMLGQEIEVDASGSYDPESDIIKYWWQMWSKPTYSKANFSSPHKARPDANNFNEPGIYYVKNQPSDALSSKIVNSTHAIVVYAEYPGVGIEDMKAITAVAGETLTFPTAVYGSLGERDELLWNLMVAPYNSTESIVGSTQLNPEFTFDVKGKYVFQLRLMREGKVYDVEHLIVRVSDNHSPVADAGEDISAVTGESLMLNGAGSFDEDDNLLFNWQVIGAEGSINDTPRFEDNTVESPLLILGDNYTGQLVIRLTVSDGVNDPVSDEVLVNVTQK